MSSITEEERRSVSEFLAYRGLTFQPLLDEMTDHICSEAEEMMTEGKSFEEAFRSITSELPEGHFITIQTETMKTINNRFNVSRVFSFIAMGALLIATAFKIMKLAGAPELLIVSFIGLAGALIAGVLPGLTMKREEKGAFRVLTLVAGTIILMCGYGFKINLLPGADQLIVVGVLTTIIGIIVNTVFVHNNASGRGNLMTYLHEKHSPGIERFLLIIGTPVVIYKIVRMFTVADGRGSVADVILIVVIYMAGLQLIALAWRTMEKNGTPSVSSTVRVLVTGTCLMLPMLAGILPFSVRLACVTIFAVVAATLVYQLDKEKWSWVVMVYQVAFIILAMMKVNLVPVYSNPVLNLIIIAVLTTGILMAKKNGLLRTYMILSVASFLLESNLNLG